MYLNFHLDLFFEAAFILSQCLLQVLNEAGVGEHCEFQDVQKYWKEADRNKIGGKPPSVMDQVSTLTSRPLELIAFCIRFQYHRRLFMDTVW